jgi:anti-anti-sigma factor
MLYAKQERGIPDPVHRASGLPDDTFWIVVDDEDGAPCVRLSGDLDLAALGRLRIVLRPLIAGDRAEHVTIDLDAVDLVETVTAGFLAREQARAEAQGVGLELRGARGVARRLLALAGARLVSVR